MPAQTREIWVMLNPVSYRNTCFKRAFESIESVLAFAEQRQITCGVVQD